MGILDVLREEKRLLLEIRDVLQAEREALIKDNIEEFMKLAVRKEELKSRMDEMEEARKSEWGEKSLKETLPSLDEEIREEAGALGRELEDLVHAIQDMNDINHLLIRQSLNYIRAVINTVSPPKPSVYKPTGRVKDLRATSGMLNKSV